MLKPKNIIIFAAVAVALILVYVFFIKKDPEPNSLVSTSSDGVVTTGDALDQSSPVTREFLTLLLNIKNIKLDDSIFSDVAFMSLRDSSIVLTPDGTEGRSNPFAPFGADVLTVTGTTLPPGTTTAPPTPPANPPTPSTSTTTTTSTTTPPTPPRAPGTP